jgi:hypothetical protein
VNIRRRWLGGIGRVGKEVRGAPKRVGRAGSHGTVDAEERLGSFPRWKNKGADHDRRSVIELGKEVVTFSRGPKARIGRLTKKICVKLGKIVAEINGVGVPVLDGIRS